MRYYIYKYIGKSEKIGIIDMWRTSCFSLSMPDICTLLKTIAYKWWATAINIIPKCQIWRKVLSNHFCLLIVRNLCNLVFPGYPNSTRNGECLSTDPDYYFLSYPEVEILQQHSLSCHRYGMDLKVNIPAELYLTMAPHVSVGLK